jgi:hypothetical protein
VQGSYSTKKSLLNHCTSFLKKQSIRLLEADTFAFMENNRIFQELGMTLTRKEPLTDDLDMLWYALPLNK